MNQAFFMGHPGPVIITIIIIIIFQRILRPGTAGKERGASLDVRADPLTLV
jgi:hypothetical protein